MRIAWSNQGTEIYFPSPSRQCQEERGKGRNLLLKEVERPVGNRLEPTFSGSKRKRTRLRRKPKKTGGPTDSRLGFGYHGGDSSSRLRSMPTLGRFLTATGEQGDRFLRDVGIGASSRGVGGASKEQHVLLRPFSWRWRETPREEGEGLLQAGRKDTSRASGKLLVKRKINCIVDSPIFARTNFAR